MTLSPIWHAVSMPELFKRTECAMLEKDALHKCALTARLYDEWQGGSLICVDDGNILSMDDPGRPRLPLLVDPRQLERRSFSSAQGRVCLLHAFAHIEFNAINIALDAVYRFRGMPQEYIGDWLLVASEEAKHFLLLNAELERRGSFYGAHQAHRGLWDMVCKTRHDLLHRMALVPRVMEARGLDVTPSMIAKFEQFNDAAAVAILEIIYRDEIGHVRIGNYWYHKLCEQQQLNPAASFRQLIKQYMGGRLRGPFNWQARIEAGFESPELAALEQES